MIPSATCRRAPVADSFRAASETPAGPASDRLKRCQAEGYPQPRSKGFGALMGLVVITLLLVLLVAANSSADPSRPERVGPDEVDLRRHFDCSKLASTRLLSLDEATACSRAFMRIKLAFVPGVGLDDYDRLPPREKAAVNLVGYRRYLEWRSESSAEFEALMHAPPSSAGFAGN